MNRKNQYIFILIVNLTAWSLITLNDYLKGAYEFTWLLYLALFIPFIAVTIYITLDYEKNEIFNEKQHFLFMLRYLVVGLLFACPIIVLACENKWGVRRVYEPWDHDMTGFLYCAFGGVLLFCCEIAFAIYGLIRGIKKRCLMAKKELSDK